MRKATWAGVSGLLCLLILAGMLVWHAYPLWVGQPVLLRVAATTKGGEAFGNGTLVLQYDISRLQLLDAGAASQPSQTVQYWRSRAVGVRVIGGWLKSALGAREAPSEDPFRPQRELERALRDRPVYVQLELEPGAAREAAAAYVPVSASDAPVAGKVNLRGRIRAVEMLVWNRETKRYVQTPPVVAVDYGLESLFVPEPWGSALQARLRRATSLVAVAAVAPSGRARLRDLLLDGQSALAN